MGCSDAAKMLIDQMKEHPEEFRGYAGKFTAILDKAREAIQGLHRNVWMSKRDAEAILAAAETHLYEVWLAEDVLTAIMLPKQEPEKDVKYATPVKAGLWQGSIGANGSSSVHTNIATTSTAQYVEQVYRMEQEKYRLELEKLRQQEFEQTMRNTKPFKGFI
jgi:hypothetical protein